MPDDLKQEKVGKPVQPVIGPYEALKWLKTQIYYLISFLAVRKFLGPIYRFSSFFPDKCFLMLCGCQESLPCIFLFSGRWQFVVIKCDKQGNKESSHLLESKVGRLCMTTYRQEIVTYHRAYCYRPLINKGVQAISCFYASIDWLL